MLKKKCLVKVAYSQEVWEAVVTCKYCFFLLNDKNDFCCLLIGIDILEIGFSRAHRVSTKKEFLEYRKVTQFLMSIQGFFG